MQSDQHQTPNCLVTRYRPNNHSGTGYVSRVIDSITLFDSEREARLLATSAPHIDDWLIALPVTSCGLHMNNEAVRVAVALRLELPLDAPHIAHVALK